MDQLIESLMASKLKDRELARNRLLLEEAKVFNLWEFILEIVCHIVWKFQTFIPAEPRIKKSCGEFQVDSANEYFKSRRRATKGYN